MISFFLFVLKKYLLIFTKCDIICHVLKGELGKKQIYCILAFLRKKYYNLAYAVNIDERRE